MGEKIPEVNGKMLRGEKKKETTNNKMLSLLSFFFSSLFVWEVESRRGCSLL